MKKLFRILLLFLLVSTLQFCNCDDYKYYRITGIIADIENPNIYEPDTAQNMQYGKSMIYINYEPEFYSHYRANFNLINSAYATSPCPGDGFEGCNELIKNINVYCNKDFDSSHYAGDTINSLFWVEVGNNFNNFDTSKVNLTKFKDYKPGPFYFDRLVLILGKAPELDSIHDFTIELFMSDNEVFTAKTEEILIK